MAQFRKRVTEIRKHLHERDENDAKSFRFVPSGDEEDIIQMKIKYLQKHIKILTEQERTSKLAECYGYLAVAYMKLNNYAEAKTVINTQLELAIAHKDEAMKRMSYSNLGVINKLGRFKLLVPQTI